MDGKKVVINSKKAILCPADFSGQEYPDPPFYFEFPGPIRSAYREFFTPPPPPGFWGMGEAAGGGE